MTMKTLPAAKFKEQCLALLDEVDPEGILVTKRGKPVAKLIPFERAGKALIGSLKGQIRVKADILSTGIRWRADVES
jgi:prevent-host-death family protein